MEKKLQKFDNTKKTRDSSNQSQLLTSSPAQKILSASIFLALLTFSARLLQILLQILIAARFGARSEVDAYLIAMSIPELVISLYVISGTIIIVPLFTKLQQSPAPEIKRIVDSTITFILFVALLLAALGLIFAPLVIKALAPKFDFRTAALATTIFRLLMIFLVLSSLASIVSGLFHAHSEFNPPALFRLFQLAVVISVFLFFSAKLGMIALVLGLIMGALASLLGQVIVARKFNYTYLPRLNFQELLAIVSPILIFVVVMSAPQLNTIVDRMFAATLSRGSVAILDYASRFELVLVGIIVYAVVTPVFTRFSQAANKNDWQEFKKTLTFGMKALFISVVPLVTMVVVLRKPIIQLLLEKGKFTHYDSILVSGTLFYLSPNHVIGAFALLFLYAFFALRETRWLLVLVGVEVIANVFLNVALIGPMGVRGIALSTSLSVLPGTIILWRYLKGKLKDLRFLSFKLMLKIVASTAIGSFFLWEVYSFLGSPDFLRNFSAITISFIVGGSIYLLLCFALGVEEIQRFLRRDF